MLGIYASFPIKMCLQSANYSRHTLLHFFHESCPAHVVLREKGGYKPGQAWGRANNYTATSCDHSTSLAQHHDSQWPQTLAIINDVMAATNLKTLAFHSSQIVHMMANMRDSKPLCLPLATS
jgi:hypothetical protein